MLKFGFGLIFIGLLVAVGTLGFRGEKSPRTPVQWFDDMVHQPKAQPQHRSPIFADTRAARPMVEGTIPVGYSVDGASFQTGANNLDAYAGFTNAPDYMGTGRIGSVFGDGMPEGIQVNERFLNRGKERYDIFCKPCHGELGAGNGITKSFGVATVVTLLDDRLKGQPDGQIFYTITHGKGTMGAYGSNIAVPDRWAIVAYVRALQTVGKRNLETIPSGVRSEIEKLLAQP